MFNKYSTILHVTVSLILFLPASISVQRHLSIRLSFISEARSNTNWTKIFNALKLHDKLSHDVKFELLPVSKTDLRSFRDILDTLCHELLPQQVHAVFLSAESSVAYEFTKFVANVPLLILGAQRDPAFETQDVLQNYKNLRPPLTDQAKAIQATLDSLQVQKYSIVYETQKGNVNLAKEVISLDTKRAGSVLEAPLPSQQKYDDATTFVVHVTEVLTRIKIQEIKVIILTCREQFVKTVFDVAKRLGMVSESFLWIGTEAVVQALNNTTHGQETPMRISNFIGIKLNTSEETIVLKALQILSSLVQAYSNDSVGTVSSSTNESCFDLSPWIPFKKLTSHCGQTVAFNEQDFIDTYDILKLENNSVIGQSWKQIGTHLSNGSCRLEGNLLPQFSHIPSVTPEILRIVGIEHGQYLYKVGSVLGCAEQGKLCTRKTLQRRSLEPSCEIGVPCYEHSSIFSNGTDEMYVFCVSGLMIDLLGLIQNNINFSYELYLVPDGKYGAIDDATERWNGMIGEVLYDKADMALGTITINAQRSEVVDFTTPYGEVGIGMVISSGISARPLITMEFLEPFGAGLWIAIVITILTILVALWFLDRKTSEFYLYNKSSFFSKASKEHSISRESVTLLESMSYTWSTLVHVPAGSGLPRSLSARFVAIFFAFAMIILSSTYTANLAANKVKDDSEPLITGIHDDKMINPPPGFHFGALKSSSTEAYFKFNRDPRMRKIYENMKHHNVENVHDGVEKVKSGEISVYIDDQPYLEHMVSSQHDCSLRIVGEPFGISGYGLVLAKDSPWIQPFSNSILQLNDENALSDLWNKWLVRKCLKKEDFETAPDRLSVFNYNGVFVFVAAGIAISVLFLAIERKVASYQVRGKIIPEGSERNKIHDFSPATSTSKRETQNNVNSGSSVLSFTAPTCSKSALQLERCMDPQKASTLKFNSVR